MAELIDGKRIFSLLEVATSIQKTLTLRYASSFWVKAEINKLNLYPHSGHCYPDLVEKVDGRVVAQLKSTLWRDDYLRINNQFLSVVKSPLQDGIKVLFCARITFDPVYGLSLRITDIDPVFSLGELEREKQESISRLKQMGVFDANRSLAFPLLPQRLAIISVQTSKGYADFNKVIDGNPWGYKFFHVLFPSLLQGDRAVESIRYQLDRIRRVASHFDAVAIIRGGGGDVGLSCFNDFTLAKDIALFPIPVLTGIGHATNETVVEMVSYKNSITPTELADFLLQKFHDFAGPVRKAEELLVERVTDIVSHERQKFFQSVRMFRSVAANALIRRRHDIDRQARELFTQTRLVVIREKQNNDSLQYQLKTAAASLCKSDGRALSQVVSSLRRVSASFVKHKSTEVVAVEKTVAHLHPANVLKRGYSITRINGSAVTTVNTIKPSDQIETIFFDGSAISTVDVVNSRGDE